MLRFVIFLLVATTATNIEEVHDFNETLIEEEEYEELKYNSTTAASFFDSEVMNSALNVIQDILLFKEVQECRPNYPFMDTATFYKHLYCYLIEGESTTGGGAFCKMTEDLIDEIKSRLSDFVAFRHLFNTTIDCQKEESRFERSDELLGGLEPERMKTPELNHIYLGPSKYPIETVMVRKSVRPITLTSSRTTFDISEYAKTPAGREKNSKADGKITTAKYPTTTTLETTTTPKPTVHPDDSLINSNDLL